MIETCQACGGAARVIACIRLQDAGGRATQEAKAEKIRWSSRRSWTTSSAPHRPPILPLGPNLEHRRKPPGSIRTDSPTRKPRLRLALHTPQGFARLGRTNHAKNTAQATLRWRECTGTACLQPKWANSDPVQQIRLRVKRVLMLPILYSRRTDPEGRARVGKYGAKQRRPTAA